MDILKLLGVLHSFEWDEAFLNETTDEIISILNKTMINIMGNFVLHKIIAFDETPGMNSTMEDFLSRNDIFLKMYSKSK